MEKRKVRAWDVFRDVSDGLDDSTLMDKYGLSAKGVQRILQKLVDMGMMTQDEIDNRSSMNEPTIVLEDEVFPPSEAMESGNQPAWHFITGGWISPWLAVHEGTVYCASWDGHVYALNAETGQELWRFRTEGAVRSGTAVDGNTVYFGSEDQYFYAVDRETGQEMWKIQTEGAVLCRPTIADGIAYFGTGNNYLYALNVKTLEVKWRFKADKRIRSQPEVHNGLVFFGSDDGKLYAVAVNGPTSKI